jgi:hypothetical protein
MKPTVKPNPEDAPLLAFGAHPDDIEFGCGGVIAREALAGRRVHLVVCSRGESATHGGRRPKAHGGGKKGRGLPGGLAGIRPVGWRRRPRGQACPRAAACGHHQAAAPGHRARAHAGREPAPGSSAPGKDRARRGETRRYGGIAKLRALPAHSIGPLLYYAAESGGGAGGCASRCFSTYRIPRWSRRGPRPWAPTFRSSPRAIMSSSSLRAPA